MTSAPETSISPGARYQPRAIPTPDGVPVKIRSPGDNRQIDNRYAMRVGIEKISSFVRAGAVALRYKR